MRLQNTHKQAVKLADVLCPAHNSQNNPAATAKALYPAIICMPIDHILHLWVSTTPRSCTACTKPDSSTYAHTSLALLCPLAANDKTLGGLI